MAAAALPAALVAQQADQTATGLMSSFMEFMGKPFFSNATTTTVTHRAKNGDIVTRQHTRGVTISNGLVITGIVMVSVWEMMMYLLDGLNGAFGEGSASILASGVFGPGGWEAAQVYDLFDFMHNNPSQASNPDGTVTVKVPPSAMAALNQILVQASLPVLAAAQQGGGGVAGAIQSLAAKYGSNPP